MKNAKKAFYVTVSFYRTTLDEINAHANDDETVSSCGEPSIRNPHYRIQRIQKSVGTVLGTGPSFTEKNTRTDNLLVRQEDFLGVLLF